MDSYDGGISDDELIALVESIERSESMSKSSTSSSRWRRPRKERAHRAPRERKVGEDNEDLSEHENAKRDRNHRLHLRRRRQRSSPGLRITDVVRSVETSSRSRRRLAILSPLEEVQSVMPGAGITVEKQNSMLRNVRRQERSQTPEWLEIDSDDLHKFQKVSFLDGRYVG